MEPYQAASETARKSGESEIDLIKNLISSAALGGGARAGASATAALLPKIGALISKYVPDELSKKGLEKLDPRFGTFFKKVESEGGDYGEVRTFLDDKIQKTQEKIKPKQNRNIIEQYDPELHTYLQEYLKKGKSLFEAGKKALGHARFKKAIDKMVKDHKSSWNTILQTVYGSENARPAQEETKQEISQQPQSAGKGQQALMAILQQIQKARSGV